MKKATITSQKLISASSYDGAIAVGTRLLVSSKYREEFNDIYRTQGFENSQVLTVIWHNRSEAPDSKGLPVIHFKNDDGHTAISHAGRFEINDA